MPDQSRSKRRKKRPDEVLDEVIDRIIENSTDEASGKNESFEENNDCAQIQEDILESWEAEEAMGTVEALYYIPWTDGEYCAYAKMLRFDPVQIEVEALVYSIRKPEGELLQLPWPVGEKISLHQFQAAEAAEWAPLIDRYFRISYQDDYVEWAHTRYPEIVEQGNSAAIYSTYFPHGAEGTLLSHDSATAVPISKEAFEDIVDSFVESS